MGRGDKTLSEYKVTLTVNERDVLRRVSLLNAAAFRLLHVANLRRVIRSDYSAGCLVMLVLAEKASPEVVPGAVGIKIELVN